MPLNFEINVNYCCNKNDTKDKDTHLRENGFQKPIYEFHGLDCFCVLSFEDEKRKKFSFG